MHSEFQGIVMAAGIGSRMTSLTAHVSKALLPIANIPMFWYPLNFLAKNNVTDVILVVDVKMEHDVKMIMKDRVLFPSFGIEMNIEVATVESSKNDMGTFDSLREIESKINRDIIVVSSDFISDASLEPLLKSYRSREASFYALLTPYTNPNSTPGTNLKQPKYRDFIGVNLDNNRLVSLIPEEDFEEFSIDNFAFGKFKTISFTAKYQDAHVYVIRKALLDLSLKKLNNISTIKSDFIPMILEQQYFGLSNETIDFFIKSKRNEFKEEAKQLGERFNDGEVNIDIKEADDNDYIKCYAYFANPETYHYSRRCNTVASYIDINTQIIPYLVHFQRLHNENKKTSTSYSHAVVSNSRLAESVKFFGPKPEKKDYKMANVTNSVIDSATEIEGNTRIIGSVIMENVKIGQNVKLNNSIICRNAIIGNNVDLTNCIVASGFEIKPGHYSSMVLEMEDEEMMLDD
uniref:Translation initiation factor eIF2B subunit gamma n=1 Tax=Parastrongyloides trichosuri TaxID=131310 RepID=A0A0N4ZVY5_PARTI